MAAEFIEPSSTFQPLKWDIQRFLPACGIHGTGATLINVLRWGCCKRHSSSTLELAAGKIRDLWGINWVITQKTKTWEISSAASTKPITVSPKIAISVTEPGSAIIFLVHMCWLQPPPGVGAGINKKQQIKLVLLSSNSFYWSSNSFIYDKKPPSLQSLQEKA